MSEANSSDASSGGMEPPAGQADVMPAAMQLIAELSYEVAIWRHEANNEAIAEIQKNGETIDYAFLDGKFEAFTSVALRLREIMDAIYKAQREARKANS